MSRKSKKNKLLYKHLFYSSLEFYKLQSYYNKNITTFVSKTIKFNKFELIFKVRSPRTCFPSYHYPCYSHYSEHLSSFAASRL